ncbi:MAG: glycosyltransferase family 2 protein [Spirochaetales bacterium]|nr:glycosyltransferase family 2 protein [Spirochaetales bacterium]
MKENCLFSVIVPAHNEEQYIGKCLQAIRTAEEQTESGSVQIIVVANRCTDKTAEIAAQYGAEVIENQDKCIASIRNAGAKAATGEILVTVDADTCIAPETFTEIRTLLESGRYIGGGAGNYKFILNLRIIKTV